MLYAVRFVDKPDRLATRKEFLAAHIAWLDQHSANRRWHIIVGALAIAASALMFVITRETENAEAASQRAAIVEEADATPDLVTPAATGVASKPPSAPSIEPSIEPSIDMTDTTESVALPASAPPTTVTEEPVTPTVKKHKRASHRPRARRAQVKPRLDQPLDPDGTLDPYR